MRILTSRPFVFLTDGHVVTSRVCSRQPRESETRRSTAQHSTSRRRGPSRPLIVPDSTPSTLTSSLDFRAPATVSTTSFTRSSKRSFPKEDICEHDPIVCDLNVVDVSSCYSRQSESPSSPRKALRIAISSLGSPSWGPTSPASLYTFLHRLRALLRRSNASSMTTFPTYLYPSTSSSAPGATSPMLSRLSHASDAVVSVLSTSSSPTLAALYPNHQGLLTLPKLPSPSSLVPPSTKLSLLRNLGGGGQGRENLLGFRVKRRRFVVEVVSEEPELGEDEVEKKARERRRRVEEANRKDREEGGKATDVLLGQQKAAPVAEGTREAPSSARIAFEPEEEVEKGLRRVQIGGEEGMRIEGQAPTPAPPTSAFKKKKGVRMGGVSFQSDDSNPRDEAPATEPKKEKKKVSISAMLHQQPELLDF